jgi:hypothetical protein
MNPLDLYPKVRNYLYLAQWIVNLILGVTGVVLTSLAQSPLRFVIVGSVFNFIRTYTGIVAKANVPTDEVKPEPKDAVVHDPEDPVEDGDVPLPLTNQDASLLYGDGTERGSEGSL